jgi:O-antigen chain-terminating methyltransferase
VKVVRTVSEADLARLKRERHDADRRYNEALTALDAAVQALPTFAPDDPEALRHGRPSISRPVAPDETQVTPLNQRWEITRAMPPLPAGWRGRLARLAVAIVRPALEQQQAFNAALVDHINRNVAAERALPGTLAALIDVVRQQADHLVTFESRLIVFLQQLTPFADTKDYEFHGLATRIAEDVAEAHGQLARTVQGLAAALSGVSDDVLKRWERYEGLRDSLASMQLTVQALRRELTTAGTRDHTASVQSAPVHPAPAPVSSLLSSDRLSSHKYVAFEDLFRGDRAIIRERQMDYVRLFTGRQDVLDVGCGRGEFLQSLREHGITGRGIDLNHEMVAECAAAGLNVTEADALSYLRAQNEASLGGLIAAQVVEHLEPDYLLAVLDEAFRVLRPRSPLVLETINVTSWSAFFTSYLRDLTHVRPIHPDTLKFVVTASGFLEATIQLRAPLPESEKLLCAPRIVRDVSAAASGAEARGLLGLADAFDRNMERLNTQLYGPLDYAVVAWKP